MPPSLVTRWVGAGALILATLAAWLLWGDARVDVAPAQPLATDVPTALHRGDDGKAKPAKTRVEVMDTTVTTDAATAPGEVVVSLRWADDDAPVVGHEVIATDEWTGGAVRRVDGASTDASGLATLSLTVGDYYVMALRNLGRRVRVRSGERATVALSLPRHGGLVGRVVDEHEVPIEGATVFEVRRVFGDGPTALATSDADGAFRAQVASGFVMARKNLPEGRHPPAEVLGELQVEGGEPRPLSFTKGMALVGLRPGKYTAVVDTEGCRGRARFTVDSVVRDPLRVDVPVQ